MEIRKVILRYLDGRVVPAFAPLFEEGSDPVPATDLLGLPMMVALTELKAVFFVRTFTGNPAYDPPRSVREVGDPCDNPVRLSFADGETMLGEVRDLARTDHGFYLTVLDPGDNNLLVYVNPASLAAPPESIRD